MLCFLDKHFNSVSPFCAVSFMVLFVIYNYGCDCTEDRVYFKWINMTENFFSLSLKSFVGDNFS